MSEKQTKLSIRIPWLVEAVADGALAILALLALALLILGSKAVGLW
jgi:hypothetical protein